MLKVTVSLAIFVLVFALPLAQGMETHHGTQKKTEIKTLPAEIVQGYLSGKGMDMAKPAELNHYPGPKHALDLAVEMRLSPEQIARTREINRQMQESAVALGKLIIEKEKMLDHLFAAQKIDRTQMHFLVLEIAQLQGELRAVHLLAHFQMKEILSPQQIEQYDAMRGYSSGKEKDKHIHHHN